MTAPTLPELMPLDLTMTSCYENLFECEKIPIIDTIGIYDANAFVPVEYEDDSIVTFPTIQIDTDGHNATNAVTHLEELISNLTTGNDQFKIPEAYAIFEQDLINDTELHETYEQYRTNPIIKEIDCDETLTVNMQNDKSNVNNNKNDNVNDQYERNIENETTKLKRKVDMRKHLVERIP